MLSTVASWPDVASNLKVPSKEITIPLYFLSLLLGTRWSKVITVEACRVKAVGMHLLEETFWCRFILENFPSEAGFCIMLNLWKRVSSPCWHSRLGRRLSVPYIRGSKRNRLFTRRVFFLNVVRPCRGIQLPYLRKSKLMANLAPGMFRKDSPWEIAHA